jgi:Zn ribbon nucleic-acid-binding protein
MRTVRQYERHAKETRELAVRMIRREERKILEDIAKAWEKLAALREYDLVQTNEGRASPLCPSCGRFMANTRTIRHWTGDHIDLLRCSPCGTFSNQPAKIIHDTIDVFVCRPEDTQA